GEILQLHLAGLAEAGSVLPPQRDPGVVAGIELGFVLGEQSRHFLIGGFAHRVDKRRNGNGRRLDLLTGVNLLVDPPEFLGGRRHGRPHQLGGLDRLQFVLQDAVQLPR
ncbi:MAG: hypothetical protein ACK559_19720, partial [bacterium]